MIIKSILLGILEGITEFLPISSTGHLILLGDVLNFTGNFANIFNIVIQMGAILSVLIYFYKDLFPKSFEKQDLTSFFSLWSKVVVGCLPAAVIGLSLESIIDEYLFNSFVVAISLIVGGIWIYIIDKDEVTSLSVDESKINTMEELSYSKALFIGFFQCLALIPGMSRSGMTIIGSLMLGTSRKLAAEFSFFMAIPVLAGAGFLKLIKNSLTFTGTEWMAIGVGTFVSFVVALLVISFLMNYIKKHNFRIFAIYRIVLALIIFVILFL